jgi:hypothetical protein
VLHPEDQQFIDRVRVGVVVGSIAWVTTILIVLLSMVSGSGLSDELSDSTTCTGTGKKQA